MSWARLFTQKYWARKRCYRRKQTQALFFRTPDTLFQGSQLCKKWETWFISSQEQDLLYTVKKIYASLPPISAALLYLSQPFFSYGESHAVLAFLFVLNNSFCLKQSFMSWFSNCPIFVSWEAIEPAGPGEEGIWMPYNQVAELRALRGSLAQVHGCHPPVFKLQTLQLKKIRSPASGSQLYTS